MVDERIGVEALETFDELHVGAGSSEGRLLREICRLDDQPIAFPMPNRISIPRADIRGQMRTPIKRNDADFVTHLDPQPDVVLALNNLRIVVVSGRRDRRSGALQLETAFG